MGCGPWVDLQKDDANPDFPNRFRPIRAALAIPKWLEKFGRCVAVFGVGTFCGTPGTPLASLGVQVCGCFSPDQITSVPDVMRIHRGRHCHLVQTTQKKKKKKKKKHPLTVQRKRSLFGLEPRFKNCMAQRPMFNNN